MGSRACLDLSNRSVPGRGRLRKQVNPTRASASRQRFTRFESRAKPRTHQSVAIRSDIALLACTPRMQAGPSSPLLR